MIHQADFIVPVEIENSVHNVYVIKRPGVDQFMKRMGEIYEVVVFTASLSKYADPVLDMLDIHRVVKHRLFRESCYNHRGNYVKVRHSLSLQRRASRKADGTRRNRTCRSWDDRLARRSSSTTRPRRTSSTPTTPFPSRPGSTTRTTPSAFPLPRGDHLSRNAADGAVGKG